MINKRDREFIDIIMHNDIETFVNDTRQYICSSYGTKDLTGYCDEACAILKKTLDAHFSKEYPDMEIFIDTIHGEQRHVPRIKSEYWPYEHTWLFIKVNGHTTIWIDPTSEQFRFFQKDIPNYYISLKFPKWYIPDRKHPVFGYRIGGFINKKIKVVVKGYHRKIGIIDYLYYELWGRISDMIHNIFYKKII